jgi:rhodanese-related sulfurtransferase
MQNNITVEQLKDLLQSGEEIQLIDVREYPEFNTEKIAGALLAPLSIFSESQKSINREKHTYLICKSGSRASEYAAKLISEGYSQISIIEGGMSAWINAGYDIIKGSSKIWSLERQVRVAAGSLVVLGVILSILLHSNFVVLSAFVGAGLIFAGVTDTCGMGLLLAKMPWNKK